MTTALPDITKPFNFGGLREDLVASQENSDNDKENKFVMNDIWFKDFLSCVRDTIQTALELFRRTRRSQNSLLTTRASQYFLETIMNGNHGNLRTPQVVTDRSSPSSQGEIHNEHSELPRRPINRAIQSGH